MLAKLIEAVPNIDPKVRIIGGFSNGAHAIDGPLSKPEFTAAFSAFILIEGGGSPGGAYKGANHKPIYFAWGEQSPIAASSPIVIGRAKSGKMKLRTHEMKATGHQFPKTEKAIVKSWIYDTVLPDLRRVPGSTR